VSRPAAAQKAQAAGQRASRSKPKNGTARGLRTLFLAEIATVADIHHQITGATCWTLLALPTCLWELAITGLITTRVGLADCGFEGIVRRQRSRPLFISSEWSGTMRAEITILRSRSWPALHPDYDRYLPCRSRTAWCRNSPSAARSRSCAAENRYSRRPCIHQRVWGRHPCRQRSGRGGPVVQEAHLRCFAA
jgi:hypothetical protein